MKYLESRMKKLVIQQQKIETGTNYKLNRRGKSFVTKFQNYNQKIEFLLPEERSNYNQ
jgi:hypothetical protein